MKATLHSLDNKQFQCGECQSTYANRSDGESMLAKLKVTKGCESISDKVLHRLSPELGFKTCIANYYSSWLPQWIEAYQMYQKGVLPFPGALTEQPNKVIEMFRVIDSHVAEKTERQIKQMNQKQRAKGASARGR